MDILDLPFNQFVGLTLVQRDDQTVVCLEPEDHHLNHVGTVHAGALYSLGEAASGHALLTESGLLPVKVLAVLRSAKVKYRKPADGHLFALAELEEHATSQFKEQLESKGRAFLDIHVRVVNSEDEEVFSGDFAWFVSQTEIP